MKQSVRSLSLAALCAVITASYVPTASLYAAAKEKQVVEAPADAALSSKVKTQLDTNTELKGANLVVTTTGGVVTLKGTVSSPVLRVKAVELVKTIDGVTKVVQKIDLGK